MEVWSLYVLNIFQVAVRYNLIHRKATDMHWYRLLHEIGKYDILVQCSVNNRWVQCVKLYSNIGTQVKSNPSIGSCPVIVAFHTLFFFLVCILTFFTSNVHVYCRWLHISPKAPLLVPISDLVIKKNKTYIWTICFPETCNIILINSLI